MSFNALPLHGCSSVSPLHLPLSPSHLLNSLTSSSFQLIYFTFSSTSLSLSPFELADFFISPIHCTTNFLFKSCAGIFFLVSLWSLWFRCCLSLKGAFFPLWFLIDFAVFHAFIYLFIWFFCSSQYIYILFLAFGVLFFCWFDACLFFFFNAQIEIVFFMHNRYSIRYRYTSISFRFKYQTIQGRKYIPARNIQLLK
jgi:hypothetical protein